MKPSLPYNIDNYRIIKEIDSLYSQILALNNSNQQELRRIEKVQQLTVQRQHELEQLNFNLSACSEQQNSSETELNQKISQKDKLKRNMNLAVNPEQVNALTNELNDLEFKIEALESKLMSLLEEEDKLKDDINQTQSFLNGVTKTIDELKLEVNKKTQENNQQIENINQRLGLLKAQLPEQFQKMISELEKKGRAQQGHFVTKLNQLTCQTCGLNVSRTDSDLIERCLQIVYCQGCKKVILPFGA
jgi:predicted  nucleic acid-binding Zn-ribbon protein